MALAEHIRLAVAESALVTSGGPLPVTVSVGATLLDGSLSVEETLARAEAALYMAKRRRPNTSAILGPPLPSRALTGEEVTELIEQLEREEMTWEPFSRRRLGLALDTLSAQERRIIELRFGLAGDAPWTLEAVGQELGLTREQVRHLETRALAQLASKRGEGFDDEGTAGVGAPRTGGRPPGSLGATATPEPTDESIHGGETQVSPRFDELAGQE